MLQSSERETEILLGNKQLLGIFFVVAALLGVAFVGGYKVGQASTKKLGSTASAAAGASTDTSSQSSGVAQSGGETHSVSPGDGGVVSTEATSSSAANRKGAQDLLGARKRKPAKAEASDEQPAAAAVRADAFSPQNGQEFLQVTAVPRDHAYAVAAVLRKKGFHAHAVPKPGAGNLYRVIVGPIHDAGELSNTRDSLRKTGFSQVIVQHYQE
jgi:cell division septation protein DedD